MKRIKILFGVLTISLCISGNLTAQEGQIKILFIGNSCLEFNNLHEVFESLCVKASKDVFVRSMVIGGASLEYHLNNGGTNSLLHLYEWNYVVLQGGIWEVSRPEWHDRIFPYITAFQDKIKKHCDHTVVTYMIPWAYKDGIQLISGEKENYSTLQAKIYDESLKFAEETGITLAPVGWAWNSVLSSTYKYDLHMLDEVHPTISGTYLTACTFFSTVFMESCSNIPYYGGLEEEDALYFQEVASRVVTSDFEIYNINGVNTSNENNNLTSEDKFRCYPNPFAVATNITFYMEQEDEIDLSLYNLSGQKLRSIYSGRASYGKNSYVLEKGDLTPGIYICKLTNGKVVNTIRLVVI